MKSTNRKKTPPVSETRADNVVRKYRAEAVAVWKAIRPDALNPIIRILRRAYHNQSKVFLIGNGGSAVTATHVAVDLSKTIRLRPVRDQVKGLQAISLTANVGVMTAFGNDEGYEKIFSGQLSTFAGSGDVLMAISASGNSPNILHALKLAHSIGMVNIGLLGMGGGKAKALCDAAIVVPSDDYGIIEDFHLSIAHLITRSFYLFNKRRQRNSHS